MSTAPATAPSSESGLDPRRQEHLTASGIMAAVGMHEYKTPDRLRLEKLGLAPEIESTGAMERGQVLEPHVAKKWSERTGRGVRRTQFKIHPERPLFACSLDRQAFQGTDARFGEHRPTRPLECKTFNRFVFNRVKMEGLPAYVIGQAQLQAEVWGYDATEVAILEPDSFDTLFFEVYHDPVFCADLMDQAEAWWERHVVNREPIEAGEVPDLKVPVVEGELVRLDDDPHFTEAAHLLMETRAAKKEVAAMEEAAKARLERVLGERHGAFQSGVMRVYRTLSPGRTSTDHRAIKKLGPLDPMKTQAAIVAHFGDGALEAFAEVVDDVRLDFSDFEKKGQPYTTLRTYEIADG